MHKNYIPVNYCFTDFSDLYEIDDVPTTLWNQIVSEMDEHTRQERIALIERIHEVIEVQLEKSGIFPS